MKDKQLFSAVHDNFFAAKSEYNRDIIRSRQNCFTKARYEFTRRIMLINLGIIFGKVLRKFTHSLIKKYYPKIQITGAERIPSEGPILFCANHPNSLIDPVLIGITAKRPVSFMAKAPLFKTPILGSIMYALGMVPAYRGRDDSRQVKKNQKSLERVVKGLKSGRAMGIFPEGVSTDLRQLGLVRGGASRIALGAFAAEVDNLIIIPLGINYETKERLGSRVWINVGKPIQLDEFVAENQSDETKPLTEDKVLRRKLTQQIEAKLKSVIVHLDNAEWDSLLDQLETLVEHSKHKASLKVPKLMRRKRIADALNYFYQKEPETGTQIVSRIQQYHHKVKSAGLIIDDPILQRNTIRTTFTICWKLIHLILWFVPALVGTLGNIVPFVITRSIATKVQDEGQKTTALTRIGVGLPIYLLWYALIANTIRIETQQWVLMPVTNFLLLLSGTISLKYWPYCVKTMVHLGHQVRASLKKGMLQQLREELLDIRGTLVQYAERYADLVPRPNPPSIKPIVMLFASTLSSLVLLSVAFVFYMLLNIYFRPEIKGDMEMFRTEEVELNEATVTQAELTVLRIGEKAKETHEASIDLLNEYQVGKFQFENQKSRQMVSTLLHNFYQARDDLLKIGIIYNPDRENLQSHLSNVSRKRLLQLSTAAMLLRHQMSLRFATTYLKDKKLTKYLNQPDATYGIPEGLVRRVNEELNADIYQTYIATIREKHKQTLNGQGADDSPHSTKLVNLIDEAEKIDSEITDPLHSNVRSAISQAVSKGVNTYLQIQQFVATEIGDFRIKDTKDISEHHIAEDKVKEFHDELKPGDILIERRDWYSSNAFLPGYWPHGALYVGTLQDWEKEDDKDFKKYIIDELKVLVEREARNNQTGTNQAQKNSKAHVEKMRELIEVLELVDSENPPDQKMAELIKKLNEKQIIEAVSEGVIHNTIEHSVGQASSVFALRPKGPKEKKMEPKERAQAIARAFFYLNRPYDFNFDFDTPNTLVCTEVVYRCYGGNSDEATLNFPIVTLMGRRTLPAHQLAIQFVEDVEADRSQYELVAWLDHDRINQTANVLKYNGDYSGEDFEKFKDTLKRSSITFVMEYKKHGLTALVSKQVLYLFYLSVITAFCYAIAKFVFYLRRTSVVQDFSQPSLPVENS
ncbi:MAG: hypothetical protein CMJ76_17150 [Planctomycetaceae bacterium]|nr:hypothetical protein [Planctomycetaceae bacterium]